MYLPQYLQMPIWLSMTMAINNLIQNPQTHSDFLVEGPLFMSNLAFPVETYFLPVLVSLITIANMKSQSLMLVKSEDHFSAEKKSKASRFITVFYVSLQPLIIFLTSIVPSGIALQWVTTATVSLAFKMVLVSPRVKKICGITMYPDDPEKPYQNIYNNVMAKLKRK